MNRKELLQSLVDSRFSGSQAEFARAIKRSPAQVHQWLTGHRKLGDAGARHIELSLGLEPEYFGKELVGNLLLTHPGLRVSHYLVSNFDLLTAPSRWRRVFTLKII